MRILVVDDEEVLASTMASILELQGYEAAAVYSGADAVALAKTFNPDLLVTDLAMPGMDGVATAQAVVNACPACRVLFISGQAMRLDEIIARAGLQFDFAPKPIQPVEMLNRISRILTSRSGDSKTILNVDDYALHRYAVTRILTQRGYAVLEVGTGEEALAKAELRPDLILLDVNLPDVSGFDVCQRLKSQPQTADIPVVFLSSSVHDQQARARAQALGAADFLTHPVEPEALFTLLEKILKTHAGKGRTPRQ